MQFLRILLCLVACFSSLVVAKPKPLVTLDKCTFIPTKWADGDSFQIKTFDGTLMTVRLYVADCLEVEPKTPSDKQRFRDQRRYFGIYEVKGDAADPTSLAKEFSKIAGEFTAKALQQPFTVHTRYHKAPGDGKHERFYAFIVTVDGKDLATELVRAGLARAQGVGTETIDGVSRERYKEKLADFQDQAAKRGEGIWKFTDWDKLPDERDVQRKEDEEDKIAAGDALPDNFRINPNTACRDDLVRLPGIGDVLADAIIEHRVDEPFKKVEDLKNVSGIKQKKLNMFSIHIDLTIP